MDVRAGRHNGRERHGNAAGEGAKIAALNYREFRRAEEITKKVVKTNKNFWMKEEIYHKVEWGKIRFDKLSKKFENVQDDDVVIVAGNEDFIDRIDRLLLNFHTNFTLVNCFEIEMTYSNLDLKIKEYGKLLDTKGLKEIKKLDFV